MSWWDNPIQRIQQGLQSVQRVGQGAVRFATQNPAVKPIVEQYRRIPPSVRTAINPLSSAVVPLRPAPIVRNIGAQALVDAAVDKISDVLPRPIGGALNDFWLATSLPAGSPLHRLAVAAVMAPTPAGWSEEAELQKIKAQYERDRALRGAQERNQPTRTEQPFETAARAGLSLAAPAEPAFRGVAPQQQPAATAPPSVPADAVARTTLPAQPRRTEQRGPKLSQAALEQASQLEAPTNVPLAQFYRAQAELGTKMGAKELVRLMKETGRAEGVPDADLIKWATQNPGLAYREVLKGQI